MKMHSVRERLSWQRWDLTHECYQPQAIIGQCCVEVRPRDGHHVASRDNLRVKSIDSRVSIVSGYGKGIGTRN